ncbi:glucose-1-phosphate cytidylyltransferase [Pseudodesulfovibrio sp.]|uniref:glucose-1-phosphate cytidylyltransferase n=1 Tax=Pseudodesulfovibrio sp. TaxID=2035812 RepID=UPI00261F3542|nr:glucose-1-phosphate cytidylyltransferase [Pseudodesulfovibrio sp.]MDD3312407.1 glucose-1-phosphate cytidylyltransferase [Pseudodesulfovibrio sp.]
MQVVIFCGGLGTRLREETEFRPKPMVNIGPKPILWHIMKLYSRQGFEEFVLPLGYKGEMIRDYFLHYEIWNNDVTLELGRPGSRVIHEPHDELGWKVTLADTGERTAKGGRLKRVEKYVHGDRFMLTYGDGLADIDLKALLAFHEAGGRTVTITGVSPAQQFGELRVEGDVVTAFHEKPPAPRNGDLVSGGFMVCERRIFDYLTEDEECDLEFGVFDRLAREGELAVYRHRGFWACMDTYRDTLRLNRLWDEGEARWKTW